MLCDLVPPRKRIKGRLVLQYKEQGIEKTVVHNIERNMQDSGDSGGPFASQLHRLAAKLKMDKLDADLARELMQNDPDPNCEEIEGLISDISCGMNIPSRYTRLVGQCWQS